MTIHLRIPGFFWYFKKVTLPGKMSKRAAPDTQGFPVRAVYSKSEIANLA